MATRETNMTNLFINIQSDKGELDQEEHGAALELEQVRYYYMVIYR